MIDNNIKHTPLEESDLDTDHESMLMRLLARAKSGILEKRVQAAAALTAIGEASGLSAKLTEDQEESREEPTEENAEAKKEPDPNSMGKHNQLYLLEQRISGNLLKESPEDILYSDYLDKPQPVTPDLRRYFKTLFQIAQQIIAADEALEKKRASGDTSPAAIPARLSIQASDNKMAVWIVLFPPLYDGEPLTMEAVNANLKAQGIAYGIDQTLLEDLIQHPRYFRLFAIAHGVPPVNGEDGTVHDRFSREVKIHIEENEDRTVDYKNLNWLQQVHVGDILCDISLPTEAVDGINVLGQTVKGISGKKAIPPKGKNTAVNTEETALVAELDGQLQFSKGQFHVEPLLTISGDVDTAVGNLDVIGNVVVQGDVRDGFIVKATGNITVKGKVEGAILIAGRTIQIGMGMNGNSRGSLDAQDEIQAKYLENCTARASGCISCDSVVNSAISSDDSVKISFGRGVIIGGTIMAMNLLEAKCIGNKSNRTTVITLGGTPSVLKEKGQIESDLKRLVGSIEETIKNISYLERGSLTPEYHKMLGEFKLKLSMLRMQQRDFKARLTTICERLNPQNCRLVCKTIYPLTQITIGSATRIIRDPVTNCNIYYEDGEINIGTK